MKVELSIAHFLFLGIAAAVVLGGIVYGVYRIVRHTRLRRDVDSDGYGDV